MLEEHVRYLACPKCKKPFVAQIQEAVNHRIQEGILRCEEGHSYPITRFIPRLLDEERLEGSKAQTQDSFSAKWNRGPDWGRAFTEFHQRWYLERYGFEGEGALRGFLQDKRFILDAGTGLGRNAGWHAELAPDSVVFGVEISDAIDIAYSQIGQRQNLCLIQGDITALPFREGFFDYTLCDQVIHHTSHPEATFKHLVSHTREGGEIAVYAYKKKGPIREFCDDFIRHSSTRMTEEACYQLSRSLALLGKALSDLKVELEIPEDLPLLQIPKGSYNLQRFFYWHVMKCFWNDDYPLEMNILVNFDWYHPQDAFRYSSEEIRQWFEESQVEIVNFDVVESGISVRGKVGRAG